MAMSNKMEKFGDRWGERQEAAFKMLKAMLPPPPPPPPPVAAPLSGFALDCSCERSNVGRSFKPLQFRTFLLANIFFIFLIGKIFDTTGNFATNATR